MSKGPIIQELRRVIVVDDDPIYLQIWEKVLRSIGNCQYCLTNDSETVKAVLSTTKVDLVISDIVMMGATGYDIAQLVEDHQPEAEILLTTGFECNLEKFELATPRFHLLYKPYRNMMDITRLVQHLINQEDPSDFVEEDSFSEHNAVPSVTEWHL